MCIRDRGRTGRVTLSDYVDYRTYLDYDIKVTNRVTGQQAYLCLLYPSQRDV